MDRESKKQKRICYNCGGYIGGAPGIDYQFVKTKRGEHFYCAKCVKEIAKGG